MKINQIGIDLITRWESFRARPYLCPAGVPTIGYGTIRYPNGKRVTLQDASITRQTAMEYKMHDLAQIQRDVRTALRVTLSENRFSALCSFVYNLGIGSLRRSTLLKVINEAPGSPGIRVEFMKWVRARDPKTGQLVTLQGLVNRRKAEADLYFTPDPVKKN
jgi:lysozyme